MELNDYISRAEVLKLMQDNWHTHNGDWAMQESMDDIRALPSVTPQEPSDKCEVTFKDDNAVSRLSVRDITYANAYELEYPDGSSEYVVNRDELIKYLMELPEYKEPTTKNDLAVEKTDMIDKSNFSQEQYKTDLQSAYDSGFEAGKKAEQEPRWIPVSERLPEEREWIGTKTFGTTISDEVYVTFESPKGERFTKHLSFQDGKVSNFVQRKIDAFYKGSVPIAWMPLPEPYKAESEKTDI